MNSLPPSTLPSPLFPASAASSYASTPSRPHTPELLIDQEKNDPGFSPLLPPSLYLPQRNSGPLPSLQPQNLEGMIDTLQRQLLALQVSFKEKQLGLPSLPQVPPFSSLHQVYRQPIVQGTAGPPPVHQAYAHFNPPIVYPSMQQHNTYSGSTQSFILGGVEILLEVGCRT